MAVKIRLRRMGSKKNPFYRIVVADSRNSRDGRLIEEIGYYDPLTEPKTVKVDDEKAMSWISKGAKPSATVDRLFRTNGVYDKAAEVEADEVEVSEEEAVEVSEEEVVEVVQNTEE